MEGQQNILLTLEFHDPHSILPTNVNQTTGPRFGPVNC